MRCYYNKRFIVTTEKVGKSTLINGIISFNFTDEVIFNVVFR